MHVCMLRWHMCMLREIRIIELSFFSMHVCLLRWTLPFHVGIMRWHVWAHVERNTLVGTSNLDIVRSRLGSLRKVSRNNTFQFCGHLHKKELVLHVLDREYFRVCVRWCAYVCTFPGAPKWNNNLKKIRMSLTPHQQITCKILFKSNTTMFGKNKHRYVTHDNKNETKCPWNWHMVGQMSMPHDWTKNGNKNICMPEDHELIGRLFFVLLVSAWAESSLCC